MLNHEQSGNSAPDPFESPFSVTVISTVDSADDWRAGSSRRGYGERVRLKVYE
jgi:hypothetical protein